MSQVDRPFSLPGDTSGHWFKSPDILPTSVAVVHVKSVEGKKLLKTTKFKWSIFGFQSRNVCSFRLPCHVQEIRSQWKYMASMSLSTFSSSFTTLCGYTGQLLFHITEKKADLKTITLYITGKWKYLLKNPCLMIAMSNYRAQMAERKKLKKTDHNQSLSTCS